MILGSTNSGAEAGETLGALTSSFAIRKIFSRRVWEIFDAKLERRRRKLTKVVSMGGGGVARSRVSLSMQ